MNIVDNYLNQLNEDLTLNPKKLSVNVIKKVLEDIKEIIKNKKIDKNKLDKVLRPIPKVNPDKIDKFLNKHLPNYKTIKKDAKNYYDKKYPEKQKINDVMASATATVVASSDTHTLSDVIKISDKLYSRSSGGGGLVVFLASITMLMITWAGKDFNMSIKTRLLTGIIGLLLLLATFKTISV